MSDADFEVEPHDLWRSKHVCKFRYLGMSVDEHANITGYVRCDGCGLYKKRD